MTLQEFQFFINTHDWTFAKTYAKTAPHEYILRQRAGDTGHFDEAARFVKEQGTPGTFYGHKYIYFHLEGKKYWLDEADTVLNRDDSTKHYG